MKYKYFKIKNDMLIFKLKKLIKIENQDNYEILLI